MTNMRPRTPLVVPSTTLYLALTRSLIVAAVLFVGAGSGRAAEPSQPVTPPQAFRNIARDIAPTAYATIFRVRDSVTERGTAWMQNSRVLITGAHVVPDPKAQYFIQLADERVVPIIRIVRDPDVDLAILYVADALSDRALKLSGDVEVGDQVVAWGFPGITRDGPPVLVYGYVCFLAKDQNGNPSTIVFNMPLSPGFSGGPILTQAGQVIAVASLTLHGIDPKFTAAIESLRPKDLGTVAIPLPNGQTVTSTVSNVTADVFKELVRRSQTSISAGISAKAVREFLLRNGIRAQ